MGQLRQGTVDGTIILGHCQWDSCSRIQQTRQLVTYDTVDPIIMLVYMRQLHYDTVDQMVTFGCRDKTIALGHNRWESYTRTLQVAQLHQTQLTEQLTQDTVDRTITLQQA